MNIPIKITKAIEQTEAVLGRCLSGSEKISFEDGYRAGLCDAMDYAIDQTTKIFKTLEQDPIPMTKDTCDLLEACREMVIEARERNRVAGGTIFNPAALALAIAAIAKAEGKEANANG